MDWRLFHMKLSGMDSDDFLDWDLVGSGGIPRVGAERDNGRWKAEKGETADQKWNGTRDQISGSKTLLNASLNQAFP